MSDSISKTSTAATTTESAIDGASFMLQMQQVQKNMQQDSVDKAKLDAQNAKINGIADSAAKAGSGAAGVKVSWQ